MNLHVSVIIPVYNAEATLPLTLEALSRQQDAPSFEVLLCDNGSTDASREIDLHGCAARWLDAGDVQGASYARNVGIGAAAADKLLFCDADDVVAPDWVARGAAALDEVDVFSGPGQHVTDAELSRGLDEIWRRLDEDLPATTDVKKGTDTSWPIILGGNSGMLRSVAIEVGGYDAALRYAIEDNDFAIRLQRAGHPIAFAPGVRIAYRQRTDVASLWRLGHVTGRWNMALRARHGVEPDEPRRWLLEPLRCLASGVRMAIGLGTRDRSALALRGGIALGMWRGAIRQRLHRDQPVARIGRGIDDGASQVLTPR